MTRAKRAGWGGVVLALLLLATACSAPGKSNEVNPADTPAAPATASVAGAATAASPAALPGHNTAANAPAASAVAPSPTPPRPLTPAQLQQFRPNELGEIPVLMYHTFLPGVSEADDVWNRTPDEFRGDLQYLYTHGYYLTSMHDFVTGDINIPAGKTPVILTFDDGAESQFRYLPRPDGSKVIDPNSAVGILDAMYRQHPDFGRAGVFYVLPLSPFALDDDRNHQRQYAKEKLQYLLANGYELGNHTVHHPDLSKMTNPQIMQEIAGGTDGLRSYVPTAPIETIALPFGMYPPHGDTTLLQGFDLDGRHYGFKAAMMVGAEPAPSPFDKRRDLMWTPRIRGSGDQLVKWFGDYFEKYPSLRYISDGDPATVTIPNDLPSRLATNLNPASLGKRQLVRYTLAAQGPAGPTGQRMPATTAAVRRAVLPTPAGAGARGRARRAANPRT
ncbi:MAG TPA: polysaccharide deacetylase family protein [Thermomicrobiales bacterium]|nr:polysaccharide deacetylase family protein [Thermomicrobiales bacterium]